VFEKFRIFHHALELEVECKVGLYTKYTIDFSSTSVIYRRFGCYMSQRGEIRKARFNLSVQDIDIITNISKKYSVTEYNCQHFAAEMFWNIAAKCIQSVNCSTLLADETIMIPSKGNGSAKTTMGLVVILMASFALWLGQY
jgi:hypothetical protein